MNHPPLIGQQVKLKIQFISNGQIQLDLIYGSIVDLFNQSLKRIDWASFDKPTNLLLLYFEVFFFIISFINIDTAIWQRWSRRFFRDWPDLADLVEAFFFFL